MSPIRDGALTTAGSVTRWGDNGEGQLGNNSMAQTLVPSKVVEPEISSSLASAW